MSNDPNKCVRIVSPYHHKVYSDAAKKRCKNKSYVRKLIQYRVNGKKRKATRDCKEYEKIHGKGSYVKRFSLELKTALIKAYGGKCKCCGETTPEFLTIDHTCKKTRKMHRKNTGRGHRFYQWLRRNNFPKIGIRLLCMNCNLATSWGRVCPHKRKL